MKKKNRNANGEEIPTKQDEMVAGFSFYYFGVYLMYIYYAFMKKRKKHGKSRRNIVDKR